MTPRVFISSTYYDLKHVRERLEQFIEGYGFEPVLFESDKVTYELDKQIDKSAYYEVTLCHVMVLIIGGRYGTPATQQGKEEEKQKIYEDEFVSITRKEIETAIQNNIPIFIFIDKNVHSEYYTYKENKDFLGSLKKEGNQKFKFAHVDSINIFRFIELISNRPIKTFEKVEEIEKYLIAQFAGLFYLYLESIKKKNTDKKILNSVNELNNVTLRMNEMLNSVGEKILGKENEQYNTVIQNQLKILIDYFTDELSRNLQVKTIDNTREIDFEKVAEIFIKVIDNELILPKNISFDDFLFAQEVFISEMLSLLNNNLKVINTELNVNSFDFIRIQSLYKDKVKPFLITNDDKQNFKISLKNTLSIIFRDLPF